MNRLHPRNTKKRDKKFANRAVINIYFDSKRKLSTDSVMKDKVKTFKKDRKIILNKVKALKEILFQKCKICYSEAATETCSGK